MTMFLYKALRRVYLLISHCSQTVATHVLLKGNGVCYDDFRTTGIPYIMVARGGRMSIGKNFAMNNGIGGNPIGTNRRCTFFVDRGAEIVIADNVGLSQTALIAHDKIQVQKNVKIGGAL